MIIYEDINKNNNNAFSAEFINVLNDQGYNIDSIIDTIVSDIKDDRDKYFNIYAADTLGTLDEKELGDIIISSIQDIEDEVIAASHKYDVKDYIIDNIDMSEVDALDYSYESAGEELSGQWQDERNSLEQDYWNSRI